METSARVTLAVLLSVAAVGSTGCGAEENPYKATPAWSGKHASIPAPPSLPNSPIKQGDSYTVYGAVHQLRSLLHAKDVTAQPISVTGYIIDSNIAKAPDCAVHKTGKADPEGCTPEVPSFWIADSKDTARDSKLPKIRVVGWARNFAVVYDAMKMYKTLKPGDKPTEKQTVSDDMLNVPVPFPLPAVGAKVKITGPYNVSKTVVSDMVSEPSGGVLGYASIDTLEPAAEPAKFDSKKGP
jgi:hypothetical protein